MDMTALRASLTGREPPAGITPPLAALWWLAKGDFKMGEGWERAHGIAQASEGDAMHDWVHALVHRIEGDLGNAGYWYRRAGKTPLQKPIPDEWQEIAEAALNG